MSGQNGANNPYRERVIPTGISDPYSWAGEMQVGGGGPLGMPINWRPMIVRTTAVNDDGNLVEETNRRARPELKGAK